MTLKILIHYRPMSTIRPQSCPRENICHLSSPNEPECGTSREHTWQIETAEQTCVNALRRLHEVEEKRPSTAPAVRRHYLLASTGIRLALSADIDNEEANGLFSIAGVDLAKALRDPCPNLHERQNAELLQLQLGLYQKRRNNEGISTEDINTQSRGVAGLVQAAISAPILREGRSLDTRIAGFKSEKQRVNMLYRLGTLMLALRGGRFLFTALPAESRNLTKSGSFGHDCYDLDERKEKVPIKIVDVPPQNSSKYPEELIVFPYETVCLRAGQLSGISIPYTRDHFKWLAKEANGEDPGFAERALLNRMTDDLLDRIANY